MAHYVVIAGPSGSGKNAVIARLLSRIPGSMRLVTATTRTPRSDEIDGKDYHFLMIEAFDHAAASGQIVGERFVPLYGGTHYGIYLPDLKKAEARASVIFVPVDVSGAEWLREHKHATTIFIMPESLDEYRMRIRARNPEMTEHEFDLRMQITNREIHADAAQFDYHVVNANGMLEDTAEAILAILKEKGYFAASVPSR